jgi:hypothetical protein
MGNQLYQNLPIKSFSNEAPTQWIPQMQNNLQKNNMNDSEENKLIANAHNDSNYKDIQIDSDNVIHVLQKPNYNVFLTILAYHS